MKITNIVNKGRNNNKKMQKEKFEKIKKAVQDAPLSLRDKKVLAFRFGFDDNICRTPEETGKMFGIKNRVVVRERIRQLEGDLVRDGYLTSEDLIK